MLSARTAQIRGGAFHLAKGMTRHSEGLVVGLANGPPQRREKTPNPLRGSGCEPEKSLRHQGGWQIV
jgi:hypothetical protein